MNIFSMVFSRNIKYACEYFYDILEKEENQKALKVIRYLTTFNCRK